MMSAHDLLNHTLYSAGQINAPAVQGELIALRELANAVHKVLGDNQSFDSEGMSTICRGECQVLVSKLMDVERQKP